VTRVQPEGSSESVGGVARHGSKLGETPPAAVRAQLLAAEHWSLLATRSTTQSEVLSRITTFLMLVSSSIVGLALIGQFTRFDSRFVAFSLVLIGALVVIGLLTQMRLGNAAIEDLGHVIGMNRLRAAYLQLDPGIARYFVTSANDDVKGVWQTYSFLTGPTPVRGVLASSGTFITVVTAGLAGAFGALAAVAFNAPGPLVGAVAAVAGVLFLVTSVATGMRQYRRLPGRDVRFPQQPDAD